MRTNAQQLIRLPAAIENRQSKIENRSGVTLTEVLMAIFVMGVGMISLLVLFPIGIHNMRQAIQDNRVGVASTSAANMVEVLGLRRDNYIVGDPNNPALALGSMHWLLGAPTAVPAVPAAPPPNAPYVMGGNPQNSWWVYQFYPNAPSPPVLCDPMGGHAYGPAQIGYGVFPSGQVNFGVPRSDASLIVNAPAPRRQEFLQRWFTQDDDITFDEFGQAFPVNPVVERDRVYSWAYVWRRPRFKDPETVEIAVVIFKGRKIVLQDPNNPFRDPVDPVYHGPSAEAGVVFRPFSQFQSGTIPQRPQTAIIAWNPATQVQPTVKRGEWLFDATVMLGLAPGGQNPVQFQLPAGFQVPPEYPPPYFNGYFYKVVGVSEPIAINANEYHLQLELDRPVKNVGFACVVLPDVVDVIEKSDGLKTQANVGP